MSKNKHKHSVPALAKGPAANKQNGLRAFRQNDFTTAIRWWSQIDLQSDPAMRATLAEAHFRRAVNTADPQSRLTDLQRPIELSPPEGRFYRFFFQTIIVTAIEVARPRFTLVCNSTTLSSRSVHNFV